LPLPAPDPALIKRGEQLAKIGDASKNLQSCDNCHGPGGVGEPPAIPYLAGQYAHYTSFELRMWQLGFRKNSPEGMAVIAGLLNDQDIAAVAAYFQQIRSAVPTDAKQME
jgi:cytochrome c553